MSVEGNRKKRDWKGELRLRNKKTKMKENKKQLSFRMIEASKKKDIERKDNARKRQIKKEKDLIKLERIFIYA